MKSIYKCLSEFYRDARGTATVEFVLLVPVIMVVYAITFGTFHAYLQSSRAAKSMYVVSDVVSRYHILTEDLLVQSQQLLDALYISNADTYSLRVSRVTYISNEDANDNPDFDASAFHQVASGYYGVDWSRALPNVDSEDPESAAIGAFNVLENADLANFDLPTMGSGAHVLLINVSAPYNSPISETGFFGFGSFFNELSWDYTNFIWPRDPRGILLEDASGVLLPTTTVLGS